MGEVKCGIRARTAKPKVGLGSSGKKKEIGLLQSMRNKMVCEKHAVRPAATCAQSLHERRKSAGCVARSGSGPWSKQATRTKENSRNANNLSSSGSAKLPYRTSARRVLLNKSAAAADVVPESDILQ